MSVVRTPGGVWPRARPIAYASKASFYMCNYRSVRVAKTRYIENIAYFESLNR